MQALSLHEGHEVKSILWVCVKTVWGEEPKSVGGNCGGPGLDLGQEPQESGNFSFSGSSSLLSLLSFLSLSLARSHSWSRPFCPMA